ncbi:bifunctional phosphoribosyl-AMP cyclohydrolase/phosphoribosyl-ATP diphosphatase HisIE [Ornithinimicrobium sediminis]|uniref:bifunctional phosphoribosyl-AMP cyclohydrolase/phosphoribosyl-ATP diphosphatase HisIE n=1 Tax=Ornithinimicrobium sediminis TaxID=2904603 RepID=UPI001E46637D|nr:bifunctional phosphoribosyl-AMP cyclohydrolase/phosphoribosyl-ATP diphosphatase HisIE [Ornithinimicrobium sediminis]
MSPHGPVLPDGLTVEDLAFDKQGGLVPGVVQDLRTGQVLMVGYLDRAALRATLETGLATFHSRSRGTTWTKGETSGNTLTVERIEVDCDRDTLLLHCTPAGPTCHTGAVSCFSQQQPPAASFVTTLDEVVAQRRAELPTGSYTTSLFEAGVRRVAQKVGEEGVETALAAVVEDDAALLGEAADLVYHLLVLLRSRDLGLADVETVLRERHS